LHQSFLLIMAGFDTGRKQALRLRAMGFCGADDSIDPGLLQVLSAKYSWIEWGVLFRPDREGTPRYASPAWVQELAEVNRENGSIMRLAAHLCQKHCQEVLEGDASFTKELHGLGFSRVQINATAVNGVDMSKERFTEYASNLKTVMETVPEVEFIFQLNSETQALYDLVSSDPPHNMSVLFDSSCGQGIELTVLPAQPADVPCGYAGGIGPDNIATVLESVMDQREHITGSKPVWIDMESSLRVARSDRMVLDQDVFSIDKCFACIKMGVFFGLPVSRFTVLTI